MEKRLKKIKGFTLVEILIVLTILGIFSSLAAPSISSMIRSNRIAGKANIISSSIKVAKSESIKQGKIFTLCPTINFSTCADSNEWNTGWILFSDDDNNKEPNNPTEIILIQNSLGLEDTITSNKKTVSINHEGFVFDLPAIGQTIFTIKSSSSDNSTQRCVLINQSGSALIKEKGSDCA
ncbi:GspH/FimT family pseudopilin [Comamonas aquatica]|uniref:GspH/FimT family pseudopilin n=1 Tax=Comamonas aquatica TaxID=225991 RepID=UPI0034D409CF